MGSQLRRLRGKAPPQPLVADLDQAAERAGLPRFDVDHPGGQLPLPPATTRSTFRLSPTMAVTLPALMLVLAARGEHGGDDV